MTRAQRAVLAALDETDGFVSAQDLHARMRTAGDRVGLTSVYRALASLADDGAVDVRHDGTQTSYRRCTTQRHHHHLVCTTCGATVEVEAPSLERWVGDVARRHGYTAAGHTLEISGTCRRCAGR